jgi:hypothetical protein
LIHRADYAAVGGGRIGDFFHFPLFASDEFVIHPQREKQTSQPRLQIPFQRQTKIAGREHDGQQRRFAGRQDHLQLAEVLQADIPVAEHCCGGFGRGQLVCQAETLANFERTTQRDHVQARSSIAVTSSFFARLRPRALKPFTQSHHQLHAQPHHMRLGFIEAQINENVAASVDDARVLDAGIAPVTGLTAGALHDFADALTGRIERCKSFQSGYLDFF